MVRDVVTVSPDAAGSLAGIVSRSKLIQALASAVGRID
jgi:hypothetical protein